MIDKEFYMEWFDELTSLGGIIFYSINILLLLTLRFYIHTLWLIIGLIFILVSFYLIRFFYFKERPLFQSKGRSLFTYLDASSFPSVHAARITFLSMTYINLIDNTYFRMLILFIWILVLLSRYFLKKHYFTDIAVGTILSIIYFFLISSGIPYILKLFGF